MAAAYLIECMGGGGGGGGIGGMCWGGKGSRHIRKAGQMAARQGRSQRSQGRAEQSRAEQSTEQHMMQHVTSLHPWRPKTAAMLRGSCCCAPVEDHTHGCRSLSGDKGLPEDAG